MGMDSQTLAGDCSSERDCASLKHKNRTPPTDQKESLMCTGLSFSPRPPNLTQNVAKCSVGTLLSWPFTASAPGHELTGNPPPHPATRPRLRVRRQEPHQHISHESACVCLRETRRWMCGRGDGRATCDEGALAVPAEEAAGTTPSRQSMPCVSCMSGVS